MATPAAADPTITELPLPTGANSGWANDANDAGIAVGGVFGDDLPPTATKWTADGQAIPLPSLPPTPVARGSVARAVNNQGVAVGHTTETAAQWNADNSLTLLKSPDNTRFVGAIAINDAGVVAGGAQVVGAGQIAIRWTPASQEPQVLAPLPGHHSATATGVDAAGVVVGYSDQQAVRWQLDGTVEPLPVPANHIQSRAEGVNGRGEVVGFIATSPDWKTTYVKWNTDGTTTPLPQPGNGSASPIAINDNGVVVGNQRSSDFKDFNALQWARGGAPTKLGSLPGEQYSFVAGVSETGIAAGNVARSSDPILKRPVLWQL